MEKWKWEELKSQIQKPEGLTLAFQNCIAFSFCALHILFIIKSLRVHEERQRILDELKAQIQNSHLRKQEETSAVGNDVSNGVLDKSREMGTNSQGCGKGFYNSDKNALMTCGMEYRKEWILCPECQAQKDFVEIKLRKARKEKGK